jgi:hypothetical protein
MLMQNEYRNEANEREAENRQKKKQKERSGSEEAMCVLLHSPPTHPRRKTAKKDGA